MSQFKLLSELIHNVRDSIYEELRYWCRLLAEAWYLLLALLLALTTLLWFTKPAPPRIIEMAAGSPADYTHLLAQRYVEYFAKNGVEIRLVPTHGAQDNFNRLKSKRDAIKVAMVQGGFADTPEEAKGLLSLGSIAYEPIWLFYRGSEIEDHERPLTQVLKEPISIGNDGSGTLVKAQQLLKINGLTPDPTTMYKLTVDEAVAALRKGDIKAMLVVENYNSAIIQNLLKDKNLIVADFVRAKAYSKLLRYIEVLNVPMGGFDLARNYPDHDLQLLSTTTNLIIEDDLHPAIQMLFMQASSAIFSHETFFAREREFPSVKDPSIPLSDVAHQYFEKGAPPMRYYLPFWLAEFIERMGLLLIPFFAFAYPIMRLIPAFLMKGAKRRILHFYADLRRLEHEGRIDITPAMLDQKIAALDKMEEDLLSIKLNKKLVSDFYTLRSDINFVRNVLTRMRQTAYPVERKPPPSHGLQRDSGIDIP